jgi:hypothetical protein
VAGRRHLEIHEAELALTRGKPVEIFLGGCASGKKRGVRFAQLESLDSGVAVYLFEMAFDPHIEAFDLYELPPLDPDKAGHEGEVWTATFADLRSALREVQERYPGSNYRPVNFGVVVDEFVDYLKHSGENQ